MLRRALIAVATVAVGLAGLPAGGAFAAPRHHKLKPVCKHGQRPTHRHPCVHAPRSAARPRGRGQQGGPSNLVPGPTESGLGAAGFDREESAITWASGLLHNKKYAWYCESFVENAFNENGVYKSAWAAAQALDVNPSKPAPRGALVFFLPDRTNHRLGHVGISLGGGRMISALDSVEESDLNQEYWRDRYAGWAYAPDSWEGRLLIPKPPDPGLQTPPGGSTTPPGGSTTPPGGTTTPPGDTTTPSPGQTAPAPAIQLLNPAAGDTLTGKVILSAHLENASGVAFDAIYATNPADSSTIGLHRLGLGTSTGNGVWSLQYDTKAIPDQNNASWGTVNVIAVALETSGAQTSARDVHRVGVSNPVAPPASTPPPPTPPPAPTSYAHHVVGTCAEGSCGLKKRAGPGYSSYAQVGIVYDGQQIDIVCQTVGQAVAGRNATSTIWDKLTDGSYVSDYYTDTPVVGGFSAPIPRC
jgi:hypothetical protein